MGGRRQPDEPVRLATSLAVLNKHINYLQKYGIEELKIYVNISNISMCSLNDVSHLRFRIFEQGKNGFLRIKVNENKQILNN